jgi:hypothetical protein
MRIVPELDHKIRREIRDELAIMPIITLIAIKERIAAEAGY